MTINTVFPEHALTVPPHDLEIKLLHNDCLCQ